MSKYLIKNLSIGYKNKTVIKNINLELNETGLIYLSGENGSGKTTFVRTITGNLNKINGEYDKRFEKALYLVQDSELISGLNGYENIELIVKDKIDAKIVEEKANQFGIKNILSRKIDKYSYGEKMRLLFLSAMLSHNRIIILDEIDKGVDKTNLDKIHRWLIELSKDRLVIFTSHHKDLIDNITKIYFENGQVLVEENSKISTEVISEKEDKISKKLLFKSLWKTTVVSLMSFISIVMAVLTVILFSGSFYKKVSIEQEKGYNYGYVYKYIELFHRFTTIKDSDVNEFEGKIVPDYFSFTYEQNVKYAPIYFKDENLDLFFDAYYMDVDILEDSTISIPNSETLTIFPNEEAVKQLEKGFGVSYDKIKNDKLEFDWTFVLNEITGETYTINFPVNLGKTIKDKTKLEDAKVYYSGKQLKKAMSSITYEYGGVKYQLLDYIASDNNMSPFAYQRYVTKVNDNILTEYKKFVRSNDNKKDYYNLKDDIVLELPIYESYVVAFDNKQINSNLFVILGYISLVLYSLTLFVSFLFIRRKAIKNYLLLLILNYKKKNLFLYYVDIYIGPLLCCIAIIICGILIGFVWQALISTLIFMLIFGLITARDSKDPCSLLISLLKTSGMA